MGGGQHDLVLPQASDAIDRFIQSIPCILKD